LIDEFAGFRQGQAKVVERTSSDLATSAELLPWKPDEFLAFARVQGILAGVGAGIFGYLFSGGLFAVMAAIGGWYLCENVVLGALRGRAKRRRQSIMRRLSSALDLMSLMMEVGGGFQECLATVARESRGHPLGDEFQQVIVEIDSGQTRKSALENLSQRIRDDDAGDLIVGIIKGEMLGTPLSAILRTQAEQLRMKRSQWAEKASQEAQVSLVFPGMTIMLACLLIVTAPFILDAIYSNF
jgi:tight adherence protein C